MSEVVQMAKTAIRPEVPQPDDVRPDAPREAEKVTRGSGNVFADLGFENPEEELAKAKLARVLGEVIENRGLSQTKVAALLGVDQPTISKLLRGHTGGFTVDRLMRLLNGLDQDVEIIVGPKRGSEARVGVSLAHPV